MNPIIITNITYLLNHHYIGLVFYFPGFDTHLIYAAFITSTGFIIVYSLDAADSLVHVVIMGPASIMGIAHNVNIITMHDIASILPGPGWTYLVLDENTASYIRVALSGHVSIMELLSHHHQLIPYNVTWLSLRHPTILPQLDSLGFTGVANVLLMPHYSSETVQVVLEDYSRDTIWNNHVSGLVDYTESDNESTDE